MSWESVFPLTRKTPVNRPRTPSGFLPAPVNILFVGISGPSCSLQYCDSGMTVTSAPVSILNSMSRLFKLVMTVHGAPVELMISTVRLISRFPKTARRLRRVLLVLFLHQFDRF